MKYSVATLAVIALATISGCERTTVQPPPTVITVPGKETVKEVPVPVPVPGPAGPQGAAGPEGQKGEPGKSGNTVVIVPPPPEEKK